MVANPVRGLLDRKRSEEHLPSSNESKEKHKHTNDKEKGTGITKYTGQRKINERHSIERVWHSAGREPSDTLPGSQPCMCISIAFYFIAIVVVVWPAVGLCFPAKIFVSMRVVEISY